MSERVQLRYFHKKRQSSRFTPHISPFLTHVSDSSMTIFVLSFLLTAFFLPFTVKSQVPKASSRGRLERVKAKLSVVTLLLPKLHLRTGLITQESDTDDESGNEAKNVDVSAIDKVAAAQKLFATPEKPSSPNNSQNSSEGRSVKVVSFRTPSPPVGRRSGVVSAPRTSVVMNSDEHSKNLKNLIDLRRKLSSEPGLITASNRESGEDGAQSRKVSSSEMSRRLRKRIAPDESEQSTSKLPLPTVEEETNPSSVIF